MKRIYGKSSKFYSKFKHTFFANNDELHKKARNINSSYTSQPKRERCKICKCKLNQNQDFISHNVPYKFCENPNCHHLNGLYDDTLDFINKLYIHNNGSEYSDNYIDNEYDNRTLNVYDPKISFLISTLGANLRVLDVGCGSGHFVYSGLKSNINITGIDVSDNMINHGNIMIDSLINTRPLIKVAEDSFYDYIINTEADLISAIGVIEHLREPHKFFEAFKQSSAKYLFYSVPMFSFSVMLECVDQSMFPRHLSGAHTHLFTELSIKQMNNIIQLSPLREWRFGTDIQDLQRFLLTNLEKAGYHKLSNIAKEHFANIIDDLQIVFDRNHFCSEIHVIGESN